MSLLWRLAVSILAILYLSEATVHAGESVAGGKRVLAFSEIRNAQLVRQEWDLSCGAAAIATVLTYQLGDRVSEREVALALLRQTHPVLVRLRLGFSLLDLKRYAASRGFTAAGYQNMDLGELAEMAPAIVPIRASGLPHFVVFRGMRGDRVVFADPSFGNRTMPAETFAKIWAGGIGFVVYRGDEPEAPNRMRPTPAQFAIPAGAAVRNQISPVSGP
jgi:uncharacterized protein